MAQQKGNLNYPVLVVATLSLALDANAAAISWTDVELWPSILQPLHYLPMMVLKTTFTCCPCNYTPRPTAE
jgi:hypothetical protein